MAHIALDQVPNVRDLGGIATNDGSLICTNRLIRGSDLSKATEADLQTLAEAHHVRRVIDLRTQTERRERPDPVLDGVRYLAAPLLLARTLGVTFEAGVVMDLIVKRQMPDMCELYKQIVVRSTAQHWQEIFEELLANTEGAVYWHCANGKDRCGVLSAVVLAALGVPYDAIMDDYLQTADRIDEKRQELHDEVLRRTGSRDLAVKSESLLAVKPDYLIAAFEAIDNEYGGIDGFLMRMCGLTHEGRQTLRQMYLQ